MFVVYGDQSINLLDNLKNLISYATLFFLSIHMCLALFTTKGSLNRYKHITAMKPIHIVICC